MKIYKMTATFGKLENATLTLSPGLNIIQAPNEWGKSTWCAFLTAMLYGIDTKERTTRDALAAKEKYAPWSGSPMAGSMEICWQGKDITIQRSQQGRIPFGAFLAFETKTGLPVTELTAANCGKMLLGIDKSVFLRTAYLRLQDLPVTDDGALRDRLNALVTTGDESGAEKKLTETLGALRNKCRHNRTGLLPQAEREREALLSTIRQIEELSALQEALKEKEADHNARLIALRNHKEHLRCQKAAEDLSVLEKARTEAARIAAQAEKLQQEIAALPPAEETKYKLEQLALWQQKWAHLQEKPTPVAPEKPVPPTPFAGLSGEEAVQRARSDRSAWEMLQKPVTPLFLILAFASIAAGFALTVIDPAFLAPGAVIGIVFLILNSRNRRARQAERAALLAPYGDLSPDAWIATAEEYRLATERYSLTCKAWEDALLSLEKEKAALSAELGALTLGKPVSECMQLWRDRLRLAEELAQLRRDLAAAESHEQALAAVVKPVAPPQTEDTLTLSLPETESAIRQLEEHLLSLSAQLQRYAGQKGLLGDISTHNRHLEDIDRRISLLEQHYAALTVALETAAQASQNLQRRFAPGISQNAQTLFQSLTGGRYDRLVLNRDFSLQVAAEEETALRGTMFRSDGTIDQLYFALRLAVAGTLSPDSPLILDDALVRFDDTRLAAALELLKAEAARKQVILFTCQTREQSIIEN